MSEEIIDLKDVMERVQGDRELLVELLDIYQEDFVGKRQALHEAIDRGDIAKIKEIAHSMKGASGNISAKPLHAACLKLEMLAREGDVSGMKEVAVAIDGYFEQIKVFAVKYKKEVTG
jgi:HPt (histidine-containing phosphotransfer) domain-containing protein